MLILLLELSKSLKSMLAASYKQMTDEVSCRYLVMRRD